MSNPRHSTFAVFVCVLASWFGGMVVGAVMKQPKDVMAAAVAHVSPCGVLGVIEVRDTGALIIHSEFPGEAFLEQVNGLPTDRLVVVNLPCPPAQPLRPNYEAQKQNPAQAVEAAARPPQGDVAHGA